MCKTILLILIFLTLHVPVAWGQVPQPERLGLQLDKEFYATGENLWYQVYAFPSSEAPLRSQVVHVELIDATGKVYLHQKLKLEQGAAKGDMYLSPQWESGWYALRAYTQWNLNFSPPVLCYQLLAVYADGQAFTATDSPGPPTSRPQANELDLQLSLARSRYQARDSLSLELQVTDASGQPVAGVFAISVSDESLLPISPALQLSQSGATAFAETYAPEQGLILRASLWDELFQQPISSPFLSVYLVENQTFMIDQAHEGQVSMSLPDFWGEATLQLHDRNAQENYVPRITLEQPRIPLPAGLFPGQALPRTEAVVRYLAALRDRRKIAQILSLPFSAPTVQKLAEIDRLEADRVLEIKDYIPFEDLESFILEAIPSIRIEPELDNSMLNELEQVEQEVVPDILRTLDDPDAIQLAKEFVQEVVPAYRQLLRNRKLLRMMEEETNQRFLGPPMYLIDNYITFDAAKLFSVDWKEVERIELFTLNRKLGNVFGPLGFNGVFALYTRKKIPPSFILNDPHNLSFPGYYTPRKFADAEELPETLPGFRPLVHWAPMVRTDSQGRATVRFRHSDDLGSFRIWVAGRSEQGAIGYAEQRYVVQASTP